VMKRNARIRQDLKPFVYDFKATIYSNSSASSRRSSGSSSTASQPTAHSKS
jgi:hypothetical protein